MKGEPPDTGWTEFPIRTVTGRTQTWVYGARISSEHTHLDMSNDSFGSEPLPGENDDPSGIPAPEDFLGLSSGEVQASEAPIKIPLENGPTASTEGEDEVESALPSASDAELSAALEDATAGEPGGPMSLEDEFEDDAASWLMEFDGAESDEEQEQAFTEALDGEELSAEEQLIQEELEGASEEALELEPAEAPSPWVARAILAVISVAGGMVGAKFLAGGQGANPNDSVEVSQVENPGPESRAVPSETDGSTQTPKPAAEVAEGVVPVANDGQAPADAGSEQVAQLAGPVPPMAGPKGGRSVRSTVPTVALDQPSTPVDPAATQSTNPTPEASPGLAIQVGEGGNAPSRPVVEIAEEGGALSVADTENGGLRTASNDELKGIWMGTTIPSDAIRGTRRVLTPEVGTVRVLLYAGELFEGRLYAVGERKVWLETKLGKMALLDWQIDSIQPVATGEDLILAKGGSVAGLQSVRVRTAGGIFYGKLVSQRGTSVTIITAGGARLTLDDAKLATAGRSATHLVDSTGALEELAQMTPSQK